MWWLHRLHSPGLPKSSWSLEESLRSCWVSLKINFEYSMLQVSQLCVYWENLFLQQLFLWITGLEQKVSLLWISCPATFSVSIFFDWGHGFSFPNRPAFLWWWTINMKVSCVALYWLKWMLNFSSKEKTNDQGSRLIDIRFLNPWRFSLFPSLFAYLNAVCISSR